MDSNSKLGIEYIPNDPHPISPNGKIIAQIIDMHQLWQMGKKALVSSQDKEALEI